MESIISPSKCRIGIANSITRNTGYDWTKTTELARALHVRLLQLYLPADNFVETELRKVKNNLSAEFRFIFHLRAYPQARLSFSLQQLKTYFPSSVLIQHENFLNQQTIADILKAGFILAPENDASSSQSLYSFRQLLETMVNRFGVDFIPVLDISRFIYQFRHLYEREDITRELLRILRIIKRRKLPLILHVIDHTYSSLERSDWRPMFEGDLPWKIIIENIVLHKINLKYLIFEYETYSETAASIKNILERFPETFLL